MSIPRPFHNRSKQHGPNPKLSGAKVDMSRRWGDLRCSCSRADRAVARLHSWGSCETKTQNCRKWVLVPEAAPWLFRAGLNASEKSFQAGVVHLQIALEDACAQAAPCEAVLLCHRGSLDPLAYWLAAGWNEKDFFDCVGFSRDALLQRYAGIIHLQTAALDAEDHYLGWPDAHRRETPAEARTIDGLCRRAWNGHHRQTFIENHGRNWAGKSHVLRQTLSCWLSDSQTE